MSSTQVIEFYQKVRATPAMWAELAEHGTPGALVAGVEAMSAEHGYTISRDEIASSLGHMDALIKEAANDESLTDDELEMVAAGSLGIVVLKGHRGGDAGGDQNTFGENFS